jgi:nucleoside-diphosphate-sugar epimerase
MPESVPAADASLPATIANVDALDELLSRPWPAVVDMMRHVRGDVVVLGAAGKMGPTLARMARRAMDEAEVGGRVVAVSRFSNPEERGKLEAWNIHTIQGDLLEDDFVASLPPSQHVVYMAGMKFGSTGNPSLTWAMNTLLPAAVCRRYADARIAAFSTGNVYGLVPVASGGSVETDPPNPEGEYAMSCLGRERTFEHFSHTAGVKVCLLRLNYACELRYGVLVDLARRIHDGQTIDLSMGHVNVIWQGDANAMSLLALDHAASPASVLNIAGPEMLQIRHVSERLAARMNKPMQLTGEPASTALLNNGGLGRRLFGEPTVGMDTLIDWVAAWVSAGGASLGKPTKFEVRNGKF